MPIYSIFSEILGILEKFMNRTSEKSAFPYWNLVHSSISLQFSPPAAKKAKTKRFYTLLCVIVVLDYVHLFLSFKPVRRDSPGYFSTPSSTIPRKESVSTWHSNAYTALNQNKGGQTRDPRACLFRRTRLQCSTLTSFASTDL